jgi:hypothetical protein
MPLRILRRFVGRSFDVQVALWKGDLDPGVRQGLSDREAEVALDSEAFLRRDPRSELEIQ